MKRTSRRDDLPLGYHAREVVSVSFPAGLVTDPNEDLNPATEIAVQ